MLYLVATPIGNLSDITFRAIETLKVCDYILCEDTRHSLQLLKHYDIQKPLKSFHQFNEKQVESQIIGDLKSGLTIALISDAGTPSICDPGFSILQKCLEHAIPWTLIPGPCALIQALVCSGLPSEHFQFVGFLPKTATQKRKCLQAYLQFAGTTIVYESPHRIEETLQILHDLKPQQSLAVTRELTKKFEEVLRGTAEELLNEIKTSPLKGEIVLLIKGSTGKSGEEWLALSVEDHVHQLMQNFGLSKNEAIKMAAEMRGVPKRVVYKEMHSG